MRQQPDCRYRPALVGSYGNADTRSKGLGDTLTTLAQGLKQAIRRGQRLARLPGALFADRESFNCPICSYKGPFLDAGSALCLMVNDQCLWCGALSRQRLQYCALEEFFFTYDCRGKSALHFAPELQIARYLRGKFGVYHTADLNPRGVDFQADMRHLPFANHSYDFVFASHVLEHIDDDRRALAEICRILRPRGVAVLPVPIIGAQTVEYPHPIPAEAFHVRAPGVDYFDRYADFFSTVEVKSSDDYPRICQLYIYEDRASFPREAMPFRPVVKGYKHLDYVPICRL